MCEAYSHQAGCSLVVDPRFKTRSGCYFSLTQVEEEASERGR